METKEFVDEIQATRDAPMGEALPKINRRQSVFADYIEKRRARGNPKWEAILFFGFLAMGYLFGKTTVLFGAIPLGLALLCAANDRLPEMGIGMTLGLLRIGSAGVVYGVAAILLLGVRALISRPTKREGFIPRSKGWFREAPQLRIATGALAGTGLFLYQMVAGGITTETLLFGLTMMLLVPLSTALLYLCLEEEVTIEEMLGKASLPKASLKDKLLWSVGILFLLGALTFSMRGIDAFGMSLALSLSAAVALFAGKRFGGIWGMVTGLVCSATVLPVYAPAFGLLGLVSGVLWPLGGFFALGLGVASGAVWSSFVGGLTGFLTVFPEIAMVSTVMLPLLRHVKKEEVEEAEPVKTPKAAKTQPLYFVQTTDTSRTTEGKMLSLSSALASLAKLYEAFKDASTRPKKEAALASARGLCEKRCLGCAHHEGCWGSEGSPEEGHLVTYLALTVEGLYQGQAPDSFPLPEAIKAACPVPMAVLEDVRSAVGHELSRVEAQQNAELPAIDYDIAAAMVRDVIREERVEQRESPKLHEMLKGVLREVGISAKRISAKGQRAKHITVGGIHRKPNEKTLEALHKALCATFGGKFSPCQVEEEADGFTVTAHSVKQFTTDTAVVMRAAAPDQISGDTVRFFEKGEGQFCAILSDGMGCGEAASALSALCANFLERLMEVGCHRSTAVKLLNQTIRQSCDMGGTTLDLAEIDLLYGDAVFLKAGAAASYVKRGTQLFRIRSKTIPLGLLKSPDTEKTRFRLEAGDVVVLLSDGISQMPEESPALCTLLSADWGEQSLQESAGRILSAAMQEGERADDMTVALIKISDIAS